MTIEEYYINNIKEEETVCQVNYKPHITINEYNDRFLLIINGEIVCDDGSENIDKYIK